MEAAGTMKVLAIDSSGITASAAVADDNNIIAEFTVNNRQTHSQTLLPMVDMVVKMSEIPLESFDAIAVASGPGSFTGLRLAYRLAYADGIICPLMDARRNQVYTAAYHITDGKLVNVIEQKATGIKDILSEVNATGEKVLFLGDGADVYKDIIMEEKNMEYSFAPAHISKQSAASVAMLGIIYYKEGKYESAAEHRPFYLRKPQAEREREERMKGKSQLWV